MVLPANMMAPCPIQTSWPIVTGRVFNAERLYIYVLSEDGRLLHSKMRAADGTVSRTSTGGNW